MNLVELRQNLKIYNAQLETFRLEKFLGQTNSISITEIEENASDLFTASTVKSLEKIIEESADAMETERQARKNLLAVARLGFLKNQTKEISEELENCQNSVRVKFQNETFNASDVHRKIKFLSETGERREVFIRLIDAKNSCANLLFEKITRLLEEVKTLGFSTVQNFFENIIEQSLNNFAQKAQNFLEGTEKTYFQILSETATQADLEKKSLHFTDFLYLREKLEHKEFFNWKNLRGLYTKVLDNFNFSEYKIPNIRIKQVSENHQTKIFHPNAPEEVYFFIANRSSVSNYTQFLRGFGKANFAAWTSKELADKFPEFVFSPDACLPKAYGFLFQTLLADKAFLRKSLNVWDEKLSAQIKQENEFWILFELRREILRFVLETQVFSANENLEEICERSAETFTKNLGFQYERQQMLWEISDKFSAARNLRAFLFAFGLREYFRERYGSDWWQKRKAFEELIDFWNAAERYKAEEMAQMIGFEMSFDLLAENFKVRKK